MAKPSDKSKYEARKLVLIKVQYNDVVSMSHDAGSTRELCAMEFRTIGGDFQACLADGSWVCIAVAFIKSIQVEVL